MADIKWQEIKGERFRTYHYPGGDTVKVPSVVKLEVRESGTHRYETAAGEKGFVAKGWLQLEIDAQEWTF